ncbi:MAG: glutamate mutase [Mesorhizobium sp.]|uniref:glutamate mutase L n=1 Tax=Mesorhizobium sp. TaxID=1871066 RepID=UPI000FE77933|nr:glutamate mutase L [Mesorhizobium sp.]RWA98691.1 MAG: glutamate mutase [Mesorhizobium sp.]RWB10993.1 MAG: glutamate mutase [Mesorhizobium sp.]
MKLVSIDIGSTWTKGAAFELSASKELWVASRAAHPTTVDDLSQGFGAVINTLSSDGAPGELFYSSSAKGGLAVAAVGIVPDLTAEMAKLTACSAGAKLTNSFAYELSSTDIATLRSSNSDIVLLTGGSDGGNAHYPVENARRLAAAKISATIVYAGNRNVRDDIERILAGQNLVCVENVLPALDSPNPEPARAAIRELFLERIAIGKGLDRIISSTGQEPSPTPYALFEYCRHIAELAPEFGEFVLIDMSGATTDVYSVHEDTNVAGTIRRGLPEAQVKRTVEGDLGMRVSARTAAEAARKLAASTELGTNSAFASFVEKVATSPEILPSDPDEIQFDTILARANIATSAIRHAGRSHQVYTGEGMITVCVGRDLTRVSRIIGTGGYLSGAADFDPRSSISGLGFDSHGKRVLVPNSARYHRDSNYLFPLLANIAASHPAAAVKAGLRYLVEAH